MYSQARSQQSMKRQVLAHFVKTWFVPRHPLKNTKQKLSNNSPISFCYSIEDEKHNAL